MFPCQLSVVRNLPQKLTFFSVRESYSRLEKNGKRSFANIEITEVPIGTNGPLVDSHTYTELCDARLPTGKRMSSSDFLGHFLGRTSYDATVKHDSCRFLCLYNQLGEKKSQLPLPIGMSHICQVAGKHSPAVCNVPSACTASVKCVLAFWVAFTRCIVDSVLIQILLDNSCLIFGLFFIT